MKKLNLAIMALGFVLAFQSYTLMETKAGADINCQDLSACCGAAGCEGPGTPSGCSLSCAGGGSVACCSKVGNRCMRPRWNLKDIARTLFESFV